MKKLVISMVFCCLLTPLAASADWDVYLIIQALETLRKMEEGKFDALGDKAQTQIEAITGKHDYGSRDYTDFQSWGQGAEQWQSALDLYNSGSGQLGNVAKALNNEFPINPNLKNVNPKVLQSRYELLQAKTALTSRAASQLAFDKIQQQISYLQKLQAQIDQTNDLKSAVDLQNRLILESNMLQLEMLRMTALTNQQQAIETQSNVNQSIMNKAYASDLN